MRWRTISKHQSGLLPQSTPFLFLLRSNFVWPSGIDLLPQLLEGSLMCRATRTKELETLKKVVTSLLKLLQGGPPHPQNNQKNELQRYYVQSRNHSTKKVLLPSQSHVLLILVLASFGDKY